MEPAEITSPNRQAAIKGLAVVGFLALVVVGMSLAVYTTRYIPEIVNGVAGVAAYFGSVLVPTSPTPALTIVPTSSTTISFGTTATSSVVASTPESAPAKKDVIPTVSEPTTYQVRNTPTSVAPYGLADLAVTIDSVGYLKSCSDENSFVVSSTSPSGTCPAVRFTIKNIGTNWTGSWRFSATIPSFTSRPVVESELQPSLCPPPAATSCADSVTGTVVLDWLSRSSRQNITLLANFDNTASDATTSNNSASAMLPEITN